MLLLHIFYQRLYNSSHFFGIRAESPISDLRVVLIGEHIGHRRQIHIDPEGLKLSALFLPHLCDLPVRISLPDLPGVRILADCIRKLGGDPRDAASFLICRYEQRYVGSTLKVFDQLL